VSAPQNEYERYLELADREACDEPLSPDERAFCRAFEQRHAPRVVHRSRRAERSRRVAVAVAIPR